MTSVKQSYVLWKQCVRNCLQRELFSIGSQKRETIAAIEVNKQKSSHWYIILSPLIKKIVWNECFNGNFCWLLLGRNLMHLAYYIRYKMNTTFAYWLKQLGKHVMVRRLPNSFIGKCSGILGVCLCYIDLQMHLHIKMWKNSFIKIQKYSFTDSFGNHLTITYSIVKLTIWQFRKKLEWVVNITWILHLSSVLNARIILRWVTI